MNGRIVNSLSGVPGIRGFSDNMECIASLRDCWAARYPEAGPHYLALRCWGLLIWQPIYLSVISVECSSVVPDITQMCQPVPEGGFICGYDIAEHSPYRSCISDCMNFSASQLQMMCSELCYELARIVRLGPRAAACMQADCVLGAILAIKKCDSSLENACAIKRARRWLDALSLGGCSGFFSYHRNGYQSIAIDRKVCCHNFRRSDGEHCSTCPKLDYGERSIRLNAERAFTE